MHLLPLSFEINLLCIIKAASKLHDSYVWCDGISLECWVIKHRSQKAVLRSKVLVGYAGSGKLHADAAPHSAL